MIRGFVLLVLTAGCAPAAPSYDFSIGSSGTHESKVPRLRDTLEDADVKTELIIDPSLRSVTVNVTNKTGAPIQALWERSLIEFCTCFSGCRAGPKVQSSVPRGTVAPGALISARLELPDALQVSSPTPEPLKVPMIIRDAPAEKRYDLFVRPL
jgi:hypothetical protein